MTSRVAISLGVVLHSIASGVFPFDG